MRGSSGQEPACGFQLRDCPLELSALGKSDPFLMVAPGGFGGGFGLGQRSRSKGENDSEF